MFFARMTEKILMIMKVAMVITVIILIMMTKMSKKPTIFVNFN